MTPEPTREDLIHLIRKMWPEVLAARLRAFPSGPTSGEREVVRPIVMAFAFAMEEALREHDADRGERGWEADDPARLMERLREEVEELQAVLDGEPPPPSRWQAGDPEPMPRPGPYRKEAVDVANFAMMIAHVTGALVGPMHRLARLRALPSEGPGEREDADADDYAMLARCFEVLRGVGHAHVAANGEAALGRISMHLLRTDHALRLASSTGEREPDGMTFAAHPDVHLGRGLTVRIWDRNEARMVKPVWIGREWVIPRDRYVVSPTEEPNDGE